jgi:hypothetical protein
LLGESSRAARHVEKASTSLGLAPSYWQAPFTQVWPAAQALPHMPQSVFDDCRSAQTPEQSIVFAGHWHVEFVHTKLPPHVCAQNPQLSLSFVRFTQDAPHFASPVAQFAAHIPLLQTCAGPHRLPQPPQFAPSELRSAQTPGPPPIPIPPPMHAISPVGQLHVPPEQVAPLGHTLPQPPQSRLFVCVSTHAPAMPHDVSPVGHPVVQLPPTHWLPGPQRFPHIPQLRGSVVVSVHAPLQLVVPAPQVHMLLTQLAPAGHTLPQLPQSLGSDVVSTHALLQLVCPVAHDVVHAPLEQTCPLPQTLPHAPQLFGSPCVFVQTPLHRWPLLKHVHVPIVHVVPPLQTVPQAPQLALSVCSSTHAPPHCTWVPVQLSVHVPLEHT